MSPYFNPTIWFLQKKMEDNQKGRRPKWKTTQMKDDPNGRQPKLKTTQMENEMQKECKDKCGYCQIIRWNPWSVVTSHLGNRNTKIQVVNCSISWLSVGKYLQILTEFLITSWLVITRTKRGYPCKTVPSENSAICKSMLTIWTHGTNVVWFLYWHNNYQNMCLVETNISAS